MRPLPPPLLLLLLLPLACQQPRLLSLPQSRRRGGAFAATLRLARAYRPTYRRRAGRLRLWLQDGGGGGRGGGDTLPLMLAGVSDT